METIGRFFGIQVEVGMWVTRRGDELREPVPRGHSTGGGGRGLGFRGLGLRGGQL